MMEGLDQSLIFSFQNLSVLESVYREHSFTIAIEPLKDN